MLPARQRFHADDRARPNRHLRLKHQVDFVAIERVPQIDGQLLDRQRLLAGAASGHADRRAVRCLGLRQRFAGATKQRAGFGPRHADGHANPRSDHHWRFRNGEGADQRTRHAFRDKRSAAIGIGGGKQKFRSAEPGDDRAGAVKLIGDVVDPLARDAQQGVARGATVARVDEIESHQRDQQRADAAAAAR